MLKIIGIALLCSGCVGSMAQYPLKDMTAEQIKEATKNKDAGITCITATYAGAKLTTVIVNVDKGVPTGLKINENCDTTLDVSKGK